MKRIISTIVFSFILLSGAFSVAQQKDYSGFVKKNDYFVFIKLKDERLRRMQAVEESRYEKRLENAVEVTNKYGETYYLVNEL